MILEHMTGAEIWSCYEATNSAFIVKCLTRLLGSILTSMKRPRTFQES